LRPPLLITLKVGTFTAWNYAIPLRTNKVL
jgi:hypothetical protein